MITRAWSTLEIKSIDEEKREFTGIASTPQTDRGADIVNPMGAVFKLPLPMMWQHGKGDIKDPVGWIIGATPNEKGIPVRGKMAIPKDDYPQPLKDQLNGAWVKVRDKLVRGLSIGFKSIDDEPIKGTYGTNYKRWEWLELSPVSIAMNADANIQTIKSMDAPFLRAASGNSEDKARAVGTSTAGVTARNQGKTMKTIEQRIDELDGQRAANVARMKELMETSGGEISSLEDEAIKEYDGLLASVSDLDTELRRLNGHKAAISGAVAVTSDAGTDPDKGTKARRHVRVEMGKSNLPPGTGFTRLAMALMASKGSRWEAIQYAKAQPGWRDTSPEVISCLEANAHANVMKAAVDVGVATGSTANDTWASPLVQYQNLASEFIELLRPATIIGRINGLRRVPFNVKIPRQTGGASAKWVGEAAPKPVGKLDFDTVTLTWNKIAVIVAMSDELVRFSNPAAEGLVQTDLIQQIANFMDGQFIDPAVAASGTVSPASVTYNAPANASTGGTIAQVKTDLATMFAEFDAVNLEPTAPVFVMRPRSARYLSTLVTANDIPAFPGITATGGTLQGVPVVTSGSVPMDTTDSIIVLMDANQILLADDGQVTVDASREASLEMDDSPSGGATSLLSLWQNNLVGLRAERYITWKLRRTVGVTVLTGVAY